MPLSVKNRALARRFIVALILCALLAPPPAWGDDAPAEPTVRITPAPGATVRRAVYFPLRLPSYALRAATLPIGMLMRLIERKRVIERVADALSNEERTLWAYPIIEGGAGAGFGGGMGLTHVDLFGRGYNLKLRYTSHINMNQVGSAAFGKPLAFELWGAPCSWATAVQWMRLTNENYFGAGPVSSRNNQSAYLLNRTIVGAGVSVSLLPKLSLNAGAAYDVAGTGPNAYGSLPSVGQTFAAAQRPAYDSWRNYAVVALRVEYDSRDNLSATERGGIYAAGVKRFQHVGEGDFDFLQYELDARHFFSLGYPRMVIALRGGFVFQQETGGGNIPFHRLATLDVATPLRGFVQGRFHDHNLFVFNAEYRFPVWEEIDGVLFVDAGRVFHGIQDFSVKDFKSSAGGGLRLRALGLMLFRFDLAYGGEGINTMVGVSKSL